MSYTRVYSLYRTKVSTIDELHNGHGSGPAIWDYVSLKCLGKNFWDIYKEELFWPLYKENILDRQEKAVLLSTYDFLFVEVSHLKEFSEACISVHKKIIDNTEWKWNHFKDIGSISLNLSKKHDYRCMGLCIGCTSISDPWEYWAKNDDEPCGVYGIIDSL